MICKFSQTHLLPVDFDFVSCNKILNHFKISGIPPTTRYRDNNLDWFLFDFGYKGQPQIIAYIFW